MNKKIIALIGATLIASSVHANDHLDSVLRDGIIGGILGGIIGNNTGSGDSETGALIGALAGVTNGIMTRRSHSGHQLSSQSSRYRYPSHSSILYTTIFEDVWVEPIYNYDVYGNAFIVREGYYKRIKRRVPVAYHASR
jgi:uncharacterized protein YcfJ|tara:strand:+ start:533 stop:949 length:417 start_codon:yes stop_codon:yes gene_type:complete